MEAVGGEVPGEKIEAPWKPEQFMDAVRRYNHLLSEDPDSEEAQKLLKTLQYQESLQ